MNSQFYAFAQKLREYRLDHSITLEEVARKTGIAQQRLKRIEQGIQPITVEEAEVLLAFYGMDAGTLMSYHNLGSPDGWKRKSVKAVIWAGLLVTIGYGGYKGYFFLQGTYSAKDAGSFGEQIAQQRQAGGEQKVSDWLAAQVAKPSIPQGNDKEKKKAVNTSGFRLVVYGDRPYHGKDKPLPVSADFQLFPVYQFRVGQGIPEWLKEAARKAPTAIDVANVDILQGQSRERIAQEASQLLKHNVKVMGYGMADEVFRPHIIEKDGTRYGVMVYSRVVPAVEWKAEGKQIGVADAYGSHIFDDIRRAKRQVDVLILTMYWGREGQSTLERYQKELARDLLDAGADMIIGHRNPEPQPYEIYKGKYIFYNIGSGRLHVDFDGKNVKEAVLVNEKERRVFFR
ncbi:MULTISPECIES: CapA family protein [Aneurinibacillus]|uniref:CapA family protein n=1 Tax=Aneurinibacillus thermoaerophilus TaxID=143495 RepID=A0A1G7Z3G1_ANETH|nr:MULTISPECIES: CapA family protein [Aneurinibacillus]AMA72380.1 hypothetical protein ACH33_05600 [Aneurinibacillus sp. XH2]MED0674762.1 CapA family protein [Aneurinibacillus thermoaerophilus]MED0679713.1 CapA family protein [Aneurinibacillus thermoaerophilus]MED0735744.1 CapA family protein [Aneurinibacillus thermoaerophilus]MED0757952.1 CapA family protein [Aneurinibacillus thermoaerophilus]